MEEHGEEKTHNPLHKHALLKKCCMSAHVLFSFSNSMRSTFVMIHNCLGQICRKAAFSVFRLHVLLRPAAHRQKPDAWYRHHCVACLIAGSRCMLVWPFRPDLVSYSLPPGPLGSLCVSQQSSALPLPPACTQDKQHCSLERLPPCIQNLITFFFFKYFIFLKLSWSALLLYIPLCPHPLSPQPCSLLPDLSSLPSCPLTASCSSSYHSRKRDTVSAQSNQH